MSRPVELDAVIFGGGAAGLWLLDELQEAGYRALLLEAGRLGSGQTVASQGILHGGLKYTLSGLLTSSAQAVRDMPLRWRRCLAGEARPDLTRTRLRSEYCHLWQTRAMSSRVAMIGARAGLRVAPAVLPPPARPAPLRACPGIVARLDEQVIDPESFVADLADRHRAAILRIDVEHGLEFETDRAGTVTLVRLLDPEHGTPLDLAPRRVVLVAGAGNADLRTRLGLPDQRMQRRPLHMVMARGPLPVINGHCVDGLKTRATITTARDYADRPVWQIGGQIAEEGVARDAVDLIAHAKRELAEVLPGVDVTQAAWATYRVDRAEAARGGRRPSDAVALREGDVVTGWPTKLVLVPHLAREIRAGLPAPAGLPPWDGDMLAVWPRPEVAAPPWEESDAWTAAD